VHRAYNQRVLDINALPIEVKQLQRLLMAQNEQLATQAIDLRTLKRQIEHLKLQLAKLRRHRFGQSSEQMEGIEQMVLGLEALVASAAVAPLSPAIAAATPDKEPPTRRKHLPEHFDRIENIIEPSECSCPDCGGPLGLLGSDTAEVLDVKSITFTVTRHIRPKRRCSTCSTIVQAPAPSRPIEKSFAGASLLALVLSWKYAFHLPLYRQCQIFAHAGLTISRTTLMQWVGASSELLGPLVAALAKHVLAAPNINADDTPIKVLAPGTGKTRRGRLWTYVRDGTGWGSTDPPAVWYRYSPSWQGKYPQRHLAGFAGKLQVDAYAGFEPLFVATKADGSARVTEIACFAHVRRKWFDLYEAHRSPLAKEALERIAKLYGIEKAIRGQPPEVRQTQRQQHAVPRLAELHAWMIEQSAKVEKGSTFAAAFNYAFNNWDALQRYTQDGHLEIDNNIAERSVRGIGVERSLCTSYSSV
jgi:transposase